MRQIIPVLGSINLKIAGICCRWSFKTPWLLGFEKVCKDNLSYDDRLWRHSQQNRRSLGNRGEDMHE